MQFAELNIGIGIINEEVSSGSNYHPILFAPRYAVSISKKRKQNHLFFFHAEPQVNLVMISRPKHAEAIENDNMSFNPEWESGLNAGFDYHCYFRSCYLLLGFGSGIHYISASIAKQANGFIFSDNFYAGLGKSLSNKVNATVKINFRHLSNAGLKEPNYGIDNILLFVGIAKALR